MNNDRIKELRRKLNNDLKLFEQGKINDRAYRANNSVTSSSLSNNTREENRAKYEENISETRKANQANYNKIFPESAKIEKNTLLNPYAEYEGDQIKSADLAQRMTGGLLLGATPEKMEQAKEKEIDNQQKRLWYASNVDTVPTRWQMPYYKSDSEAITEMQRENKYKDYTYSQLIEESNKISTPSEKEWLKNRADELATSEQLQVEYDALCEEYKNLPTFNEEADQRKVEIEEKLDTLENLIEKKKHEEDKQKNYTDVLQNDVRTWTTLQKYYMLQKGEEFEETLKATGAKAEDYNNEAYNYVQELSKKDKQKIISDFEKLNNKDTLYKYYTREQEAKEASEETKKLKKYAHEHKIMGPLVRTSLNTYGAISDATDYIKTGADRTFNGGDGYINPSTTNVAKAQKMQEAATENMTGLGKFLYDTGMSMADFVALLPLNLVPGGQAASLAIMGTSAGVSSANTVVKNGGNVSSAIKTGLAAGLAEAFFEKLSLDELFALKKLDTDSMLKYISKSIFNNAKTEAFEEGGTEIANAITDQMINGDLSQLSIKYDNYIKEGYSESEAWKKVAVEFGIQVGQSVAGGALSGGILGASGAGISYGGYKLDQRAITKLQNKQNKEVGQLALEDENFSGDLLLEQAKSSSNEKAVKLADSIEKERKGNSTNEVSPIDVGNMIYILHQDQPTYNYDIENTEKQEIINNNYTEDGMKKADSKNEVSESTTIAFGENHPNGISVTTNSGTKLTVFRIESSAKDFDASDNNVILKTKEGKLINADDVTANTPYFNELFSYAKNFDTLGARAFVSQYETYVENTKERGRTPDISEYAKSFEDLYQLGKMGVTYESVKTSGNYTKLINKLGGIAYTAVQVGNNDVNVNRQDESNKLQKIRVTGERDSINSKVHVEKGSENSVVASEEQIGLLQAVAEKTGRDIVLTDNIKIDNNAYYNPDNGKIYIRADLNGNYLLPVALHEATHGIREDSLLEYQALCDFVVNYLVSKGENVEFLLNDIKIKWQSKVSTREDALEELVCQTVMAIATDEAAINKALSLKENQSLLQKVASALKKIANSIKQFIKDCTTNIQAQAWIDDAKAIEQLAERFSIAAESAKNVETVVAGNSEQKNNTSQGVKYSIDKNFEKVYDNWDKKTGRFAFRVGTTSTVLQKLGIDNKKIWWDATKIIKIKKNHPEMTDSVIKQVPNVLEYPIIVMESVTNPDRIVVLGDVYDSNNVPVLVALELNPISQNGSSLNIIKIASAYGKDTNLQGLINKSNVLYVEPNRKRTHNWLTVNRLYLPLPSTNYGFLGTIKSQSTSNVNSNSKKKRSQNVVDDIIVAGNSEQKNNTSQGVDKIKYSVDKTFAEQIEEVKNKSHNTRYDLYVSETPKVLIDLKFSKGPLLMRNGKVSEILKKHSEMSYEKLKLIPEAINDPLMILESKTHPEDSVVVISEIDTDKGNMILPIWVNQEGNYIDVELGEVVLDTNFVATAYGRNLKSLLEYAMENEGFLYVNDNKKRVEQLFARNGLQLPTPLKISDSKIKVSQNIYNVKSQNKKYSVAGELARTANVQQLDKAIKLENAGKQSEYIRQQTGWFRGNEGKWKFEINDRDMKFRAATKQDKANAVNYIKNTLRNKDLKDKIANDTAIAAEEQEYYDLDEAITKYETGSKLSDYMQHPELYKAYPQLKEIKIYFRPSVNKGEYNSDTKTIIINPMNSAKVQREAVIHEVQHAIQDIEGFAKGSSVGYWQGKGNNTYDAYDSYQRTAGEIEARDTAQRLDYTDEQRKNIRPDIDRTDVVFADSNISFKSMDEYPYKVKTVIDDYLTSVNPEIVDFVLDVENGNNEYRRLTLSNVTQKQVEDIKRLLNKDVTGYKNAINTSGIEHIIKRHGKNGKQDHSMSNEKDVARMQYVIDNYDDIEILENEKGDFKTSEGYMDKNNNPMPMIRYSKKINGTYYVVEAVGENKYKKIWIVSAYISKRKEDTVTQVLDAKIPKPNVQNDLASSVSSKETVPQNENDVKSESVVDDNIPDIRYAVDDTITDGMFADGEDLFSDEGNIYEDKFDRAVKSNPALTVTKIYNSAAKTAESGIKLHNDVKLDDKTYKKIARNLMSRYHIDLKSNPEFDVTFAETIKAFTEQIESGKYTSFAEVLESIVDECKDSLLLSGEIDNTALQEEREQILDYLKGKTLFVTDYAESDVRETYGSIANYRRKIFGKVNVGLERNNPKGKALYIEDLISFVEENFPYLISDDCDRIKGFKWLDNLLNNVLQPKFINPYVEGFYESIDTAAIEMTFDMTTEIIDAKAKQVVNDKKSERKKTREITKIRKQALAEREAILKAKTADYKQKYQEEHAKRIEIIQRTRESLLRVKENDLKKRKRMQRKIDRLLRINESKTKILNMGYDTIREEYWNARYKTQAIERFNRLLKRLQKKYVNPTKRSHMPSLLSDNILNVMEIFVDVKSPKSVKVLQNSINELQTAYRKSTVEMNYSESFQQEYYKEQAEKIFKKTNEKVEIPKGLRENILDNIEALNDFIKKSGKTKLYEFDNAELDSLTELFELIEGSISDENKIMLKGKEFNAYKVSREIEKEFVNIKGTKLTGDTTKDRILHEIKVGSETFKNWMNDPVRFARRMVNYQDNSTFVEVMEELNRGQTTAQTLNMRWTNQAESVFQKYDSKQLEGYKRDEITKINNIPFTRDLLVEFILEYEDEYGYEHLLNKGYTKVPDIKYLKRKNQNKAYDSDVAKNVIFEDKESLDAAMKKAKKIVFSDDLSSDVYRLCRKLYNVDMQEAINDIARMKYGYDIARVKNYCPITIDANEVEQAFADVLINRSINSRSFLHMRTHGKNGLKLMGALDKLGKQIDAVSSWCGLTIPIEGFSKIYNINSYSKTLKTSNGKEINTNKGQIDETIYFPSVKKILSQTWGDRADKYISKLMGNLQGANKNEVTTLDVLTSNYMKGVLTLNASAGITQLSSYPLAASVTGWKPVIRGIKHIRPLKHTPILNKFLPERYKHNIPLDEIAKYSPILWYRQRGNNSRDIYEINKYKRLGDPEKLLERTGNKLHLDLSMNWLQKMDNIMVSMNYWISYEYVKNDLKINPESKEFMPKVVETLEEIINSMMPNGSTMQQGQMLRSKNIVAKIFTICKSQIFTMGNAILDVSGEYNAKLENFNKVKKSSDKVKIEKAKSDLNKSAKKLARTTSAVLVAMMLSALLKNFVKILFGQLDAFKDDDEQITGKSIAERLFKDFLGEVAGCFLAGEQIYGILLAIFDGDEIRYAINIPGLELLNDIFDNIIDIAQSDKKFDSIVDLVTNIGLAWGLPTTNAKKIVQAVYNHIVNGAFYDITAAVNNYGEVTTERYTSTCYNALINGDKELFNTYKQRWLMETKNNGEPIDEDYINNKLQDELENNDEIIVAADALKCGNLEKYENIVKKYTELGFDENTVVGAIKSSIDNLINGIDESISDEDKILKWLTDKGLSEEVARKSYEESQKDEQDEKEEKKEGEIYTYSDAFEALKSGDTESYNRMCDYLIEECDKEEKDITSAMRSASRTDPLWKEYIEVCTGENQDLTRAAELKETLTNIYGSWTTAKTYLNKYQKRMKEKEKNK